MDSQSRHNRDDPFTHPNHHHHHLLGPPIAHHLPQDQHLKRPLPVNGHPKMPDSPHSHLMLHPGTLSLPHPPTSSAAASSHTTMPPTSSASSSSNLLTGMGSPAQPQANNNMNHNNNSTHIVEEYLQSQINRWRSNNLEMTDLIGELLTVMPPEDQMQFMTGIMELIYKKRNNPEEEKQMRKYFLGGSAN